MIERRRGRPGRRIDHDELRRSLRVRAPIPEAILALDPVVLYLTGRQILVLVPEQKPFGSRVVRRDQLCGRPARPNPGPVGQRTGQRADTNHRRDAPNIVGSRLPMILIGPMYGLGREKRSVRLAIDAESDTPINARDPRISTRAAIC